MAPRMPQYLFLAAMNEFLDNHFQTSHCQPSRLKGMQSQEKGALSLIEMILVVEFKYLLHLHPETWSLPPPPASYVCLYLASCTGLQSHSSLPIYQQCTVSDSHSHVPAFSTELIPNLLRLTSQASFIFACSFDEWLSTTTRAWSRRNDRALFFSFF